MLTKQEAEKIMKIKGNVRGEGLLTDLEYVRYMGYFFAFSDITEVKALQENLEKKVEERTKELQRRVEELEKFHKLTVGRELKMIELKKEIKKLKGQ